MSEPTNPPRPDLTKRTGSGQQGGSTAAGASAPPGTGQPSYGPPSGQQGFEQPGYQQPEYQAPGQPQYGQAGYPQAGYSQAGYPQQPGHEQAGYGQPSTGQSGYPQPGYPQPGYAQSGSYGDGYTQTGAPQSGEAGYGQPNQVYGAEQGGYSYAPAGAAGYGNYAPAGPSRGLAIGALVAALLSITMSWIPFFGLIFGLLALIAVVLGIVALVQVRKGRAGGRGMAIAGIVIGVLSLLLSIGVSVATGLLINETAKSVTSSFTPPSIDSSGSDAPLFSTDKDEILANYLDVTTGAAQITGDPSFPETKVPVTLTNKGSAPATFSVTLAATKNGQETDTDIVTSDRIEPGDTATLDAFTFVTNKDDIEGAQFTVKDAMYFPEH